MKLDAAVLRKPHLTGARGVAEFVQVDDALQLRVELRRPGSSSKRNTHDSRHTAPGTRHPGVMAA